MSAQAPGESSSGLRFRLGPVPVHMPWSGLLGVLLIAYLWSPTFAERGAGRVHEIVVALVFAVLFYASVLLHEVGHAVVARSCGYPVQQIVLWVLGGYTSYERHDESSWREGVIAAAGPITSLLLGAGFGLAASSGLAGTHGSVLAVVSALAWTNTLLGIYNALPGLPLDGGAVLKGIVWAVTGSERRGTLVAGWSGRVVAVVVFLGPIVPYLLAGEQPPITLVVIALMIAGYLFVGAGEALRRARVGERVPGLDLSRLTRRAIAVPRDLPLSEALLRVAAAGASAFVVVDGDGRPVGVGQDDAVRAVPLQRRPWVPAGSVSRAVDGASRLTTGLTGHALLAAMQASPATDYLVVDARGALIGVLATADVERALTTA